MNNTAVFDSYVIEIPPTNSGCGATSNSLNSWLAVTASYHDPLAQEWDEWEWVGDNVYGGFVQKHHRRDGLAHALYLFARRLERLYR